MNSGERIFIHPRCQSCETTYPQRILDGQACSHCGRVDWVEKHEPAFDLIHQWADGWYGIQYYENVHRGDEIELLVAGEWSRCIVDHVDGLGFYVRREATGLDLEYRYFQSEHVLWRWPGRHNRGWVGPFASREAVETVRHDWAPGYLVCGVCGWDGWKTEIAEHYQAFHGTAADTLARDQVRLRRPRRRLA